MDHNKRLSEMTTETQNRRSFSRVICNASVEIIDGERTHKGELLDLSLKGALVEVPADWSPVANADYSLRIMLEDNDTEIDMDCSLAHIEDQQLGFSCHHIDLDSITYLKRLIELNLENHDLLERELSALSTNA